MTCSATEVTTGRRAVGATTAGLAAAAGMLTAPGHDAAATIDCPDVEVVFARGTSEPPGVGWMGRQFVDALRWRVGPRPLAVYAVDYPALADSGATAAGVDDATAHIRATALGCPATAIVVGGFSRGAAVIGYATASAEMADHVRAVVLLGKPSNGLLESRGAPPVAIDPAYAGKTIDLCAPGDPICAEGTDGAAHHSYAANGMIQHAADFVAERLSPPEIIPPETAPDGPPA